MKLALIAAALMSLSTAASADRLTEPAIVKPAKKMSEHIADSMTLLGDEIGLHLSDVSMGLVDLQFDGRKRRAKFHLGSAADLGFQFKADVLFRHGQAHVNAQLKLDFGGHEYDFKLPEVQVVPQSYRGEQYVELRLPLFRGTF